MKILMGITYYHPNISGVTIYAKRLAEGLVLKGHKVTVICSRHLDNLPRVEYLNGVKVVRSPVFLKIGKGVIMPLLPIDILREISGVKAVNCHLPQFESFVFAIIAKLFGKGVFLTHHTDLSGWKGLLNRISEGSVSAGQFIAGILADKLLPYTKDYADHSKYLQKFRGKLEYILPPITSNPINKDLSTVWKKQIGGSFLVIGFAGRIAKQKGIPYLLKAIPQIKKKIPNFKIVLAGPYKEVIGESYFSDINYLIKKYKKYLIFLGGIEQENMSGFYNLCDVLVLPSDDRLESFGLVQVEAMLQGCPVVASNLPGVRVPIELTGMGKVFEVGDTKGLAQAIIEVLKNKKDYLLEKEKVENIFSFQNTIKRYENIFLQGN